MRRARDASVAVRYRFWSRALRSSAPRMVTFTTLAESKRAAPLSEQDTPRIGSATARATESERLRRAAQMSLASRAATVGCDAEVQLTIPTVVVEAAGAATAAAAGVAARAAG